MKLKKTVCKLSALCLAIVLLFSFAGCGRRGVRVTSVEVSNSDFFGELFRSWRFGDEPPQPDTDLYNIACAFCGTYEMFEKTFLYRYDSYLGMECTLSVRNNTDAPITATGVQVVNDGYEQTYICPKLGNAEDVVIEAGETKTVKFLFLGNGSVYTNEEFINKIFPQMPMQLLYTDAAGAQQSAAIEFKTVKAQ